MEMQRERERFFLSQVWGFLLCFGLMVSFLFVVFHFVCLLDLFCFVSWRRFSRSEGGIWGPIGEQNWDT